MTVISFESKYSFLSNFFKDLVKFSRVKAQKGKAKQNKNKKSKTKKQKNEKKTNVPDITFRSHFDLPKYVEKNLNHEIEHIIQKNEYLAEPRIENEIHQLLLKYNI